MVTGGLRLISSNSEKATELGVSSEAPAQGVSLVVDMVGQWNAAAAGKRAGFEVGDVIVSVDGLRLPMSESQLFAHLLRTKKPGDTLAVEILRKGKMRTLKLPIQE
jgi:S1-C subfamily serine protease